MSGLAIFGQGLGLAAFRAYAHVAPIAPANDGPRWRGRAWTRDEDAVLRTCAEAGLSSGATARRLPGRTRNMVMGRAWRLGVHFRSARGRRS